jgi:phosphate transport system substrate-binding protein
MVKKIIASIILISSLFILSCGSKGSDKNKLTGDIKIDGSSTVYPITEAVAEEFRNIQPDVKVTIGVSGTGGGFKKFGRGETDISDASRLIKDSEKEVCKENKIDYIGLEIAYDGMAVLVNPKNTWVDKLTVAELKKIWEPEAQNKIMKWNQIRPEWPDKEIHLFGPGTASGTYDYFTEAIVGKSGASRGDFTASEDDNVLVQGIKGDVLALGFFGLAYYEENKQFLKLVPIDDGNGPVVPSAETVLNKTYKPLSRPIFIYINSKSAKRPEVVEFVNFYLDNVKALVPDVGYIPLQDQLNAQEKQKFQDFLKSLK